MLAGTLKSNAKFHIKYDKIPIICSLKKFSLKESNVKKIWPNENKGISMFYVVGNILLGEMTE